jgi:probable HAF family extracellular repeat protein
MKDLGTLGGSVSWAHGLNDAGEVVGESTLSDGLTYHAFLYDGTAMNDLGTLGGAFTNSQGLAVNSFGEVVGDAYTAGNTAQHAYLYDGTAMRDLNSLIPAGSGWVLQYATGINDAGQITGYGTVNGQVHAFLLTPLGAAGPGLFAVHLAAGPQRATAAPVPLAPLPAAGQPPSGPAAAPGGFAAGPAWAPWMSPVVTALPSTEAATPSAALRSAARLMPTAALDLVFAGLADGAPPALPFGGPT